MAEFLTTHAIAHYIEQIIQNAKSRLILLSPYLQLSRTLFERLKDADRRNVRIIVVYGKDQLDAEEKSKLEQLKNLRLSFCKNLHAKCFFNEEQMVIASMNMYEFSEKNNREMGVLLTPSGDGDAFKSAVKEARSILDASSSDNVKRPILSSERKTLRNGYCLRCGASIPFDLDAPYCRRCFRTWEIWEDPKYEESFCHMCGKPSPTTMLKPRCYICYSRS